MHRKDQKESPSRTLTSAGFQETPDGCFCLLSVGSFDLLDIVGFTYPRPGFGLQDRNKKKSILTEAGKQARLVHSLPTDQFAGVRGTGLHQTGVKHKLQSRPNPSSLLLAEVVSYQEEECNNSELTSLLS